MDDDSPKDMSKMVIAIAAAITTTGVSSYYVWQIILGIPFLQSLIAVSTTIVIILAEAIFIWWAFVTVRHKQITSKQTIRQKWEEIEDGRRRRGLPPGY